MIVAMTATGSRSPGWRPAGAGRLLHWVLEVSLLVSAGGTVITGVFADRLGLHDLGVHRRLGYVMAGLALAHVVLHRRALRPPWLGRPGTPRGAVRGPSDRADPSGSGRSSTGATGAPVDRSLVSRRAALLSGFAGLTGAGAGWLARGAIQPAAYEEGDVGLFYHRESSLGIKGLLGSLLDWGSAPAPYKTVAGGEPLPLPPVPSGGGPPEGRPPEMSVAQAIQQRRSRRDYDDRALTAAELAWIVQAATGITAGGDLRTAPSAGALHPIEVYVAAARVDEIPPGVYHVDVRAQALEPLRQGAVSDDLVLAALGQELVGQAPVVLVLTALFQRTRWKYHARHYRYVCWEAGHIAQNVYLAAEAAGLGACVVGAFLDGRLNDVVGVDGRAEAALGMVAVGARRR